MRERKKIQNKNSSQRGVEKGLISPWIGGFLCAFLYKWFRKK